MIDFTNNYITIINIERLKFLKHIHLNCIDKKELFCTISTTQKVRKTIRIIFIWHIEYF